jgi:DNA replication protein DnaC
LFDGLCKECAVNITAYNRYYESNIPIEYWHLDMEKDFFGSKNLYNEYKTITNDLKQFYMIGRSVCFVGKNGTGKTFTTSSILKKACHRNYMCLYTTLSDIVNILTVSPNDEKYIARRELSIVDFLVIDEFDNRFMPNENTADLFGRMLEHIFRTRAQNKLPTIMCSNSPNPVEAFTGALKQSIDSLMSKVKIIPVLGEDFRKVQS